MSSYTPPFTITEQILTLVSNISEKIGKIGDHKNLITTPHLRRNNRIRSIHSSLKIEANSLSLDEVRDVIGGHPVLGNKREIQEVKNAYIAYNEIPHINPTNITDLKKIHGLMTQQILSESGVFRKVKEGIFAGGKCIFVAPPPKMVNKLIKELLTWLKKNENKVHPLITAAVFHYEFVFIHPFIDGNGRMARLWHTVILYRWRSIFEYIPIESQIEKFQQDYYDAIAKSNNNGDSTVFIEFMLNMIDKTLDEIITQTKKANTEASKYVKKMLDIMEYDIPYTSNEIMERLGLRSKETLRKNYINPAIELKLIKMTLPKKPKSKNQRYIKL